MNTLLINHKQEHCGVHQFGKRIGLGLEKYLTKYNWHYCTAGDINEFYNIYEAVKPVAVIFNWYPSTMPWAFDVNIPVPKLAIVHEKNMLWNDGTDYLLGRFPGGLIHPDITMERTNPKLFTTNIAIPDYVPHKNPPEKLTIGTFGFGLGGKGYHWLINMVHEQFDEAIIRLHIPFAAFGDSTGVGAKGTVAECQAMIKNPKIQIIADHDFFTVEGLIDWLADNTLNTFLYDNNEGRGVSGVIDFAIASRRPMAITRSAMFRHLGTINDIYVEENTLPEIISKGTKPLEHLYNLTVENLTKEYDAIIDSL